MPCEFQPPMFLVRGMYCKYLVPIKKWRLIFRARGNLDMLDFHHPKLSAIQVYLHLILNSGSPLSALKQADLT